MFSFPQIDPETTGRVTQMPVPLEKYLSASFDAGQHDSAFNSVMRMSELGIDEADQTSPMLDAETANKKYAVGDLKFDQPIRESVAQTINQRKKDEMDRQFYLSNGVSRGRFLPGMSASILGGMMNPLDLGLMFVPIVGEERLAAKLATGGAGAVRQAIARGLITHEAIVASGIPVPRLVGSVIQGTLNQALFEIPNLAASSQDHADYTLNNALINVGMGGAFAGAIHAAGTMLGKLTQGTKNAMIQEAVNQFLKDEDIRVHDYVSIDENAIREKIKFDAEQVTKDAAASLNMDEIRAAIKSEYGETVRAAAIKYSDGTVKEAPAHFMIDQANPDLAYDRGAIEGFVTDKGRFVSRDEAASIAGVGHKYMNHFDINAEGALGGDSLPMGFLPKIPEHIKTEEDFWKWKSENKKQLADEYFFSRPETQVLIEKERERRINEFIEKKRQEHQEAIATETKAEISRQQKAGRILSPETIEKYLKDDVIDPSASSQVEKDVENLKKNLEKGGDSNATKTKEGKAEGVLSGLSPEESKLLESVPKPQEKSVQAALDCLPKKII
jgi:hypothetical protein